MVDHPIQQKGAAMPAGPTRSEVDAFLEQLKTGPSAGGGGRLIFALDATASRAPTWDAAVSLQAAMFDEVEAAGGLDVQLVYYRGIDECRASKWVSRADHLANLMRKIRCDAGATQIGKVLSHAVRETKILKVAALIFVGDAMEENPDVLIQTAGELGRLGCPAFLFQEGASKGVERTFRAIAKASNGAHLQFDTGAIGQLRDLLKAVAIFASGGIGALQQVENSGAAKLLLAQLKK
jgi:hypothetical protein